MQCKQNDEELQGTLFMSCYLNLIVAFLTLIISHHDTPHEKASGPWFSRTKPKLAFMNMQKDIVAKQVTPISAWDGRILSICVKNEGSVSRRQVSGGEGVPCITQNPFLSGSWKEAWVVSNLQPPPSTKIRMEVLMTSQYGDVIGYSCNSGLLMTVDVLL